MAKEFFKAEYIKGFPHGDIKITHNMSYEHIKALHIAAAHGDPQKARA